jgi:hypothetical protein
MAQYNLRETTTASENFRKAFELRDRVSARERFYIEAASYSFATEELDFPSLPSVPFRIVSFLRFSPINTRGAANVSRQIATLNPRQNNIRQDTTISESDTIREHSHLALSGRHHLRSQACSSDHR